MQTYNHFKFSQKFQLKFFNYSSNYNCCNSNYNHSKCRFKCQSELMYMKRAKLNTNVNAYLNTFNNNQCAIIMMVILCLQQQNPAKYCNKS